MTIEEMPDPSSTTVRALGERDLVQDRNEGRGPERAFGPRQVGPPVEEGSQDLPGPGVPVRRVRRSAQRPLNSGSRFCANAMTPSTKSFEWPISRCWSASASS